MIIDSEPNGMLMVRYKFYFNQRHADPEDPWILDYLETHGLEPRRVLEEEHEGVPYKLYHFGQCYLARHLRPLSELYKKGIEHSALAKHMLDLLDSSEDEAVQQAWDALDDLTSFQMMLDVAAELYDQARFDVGEDAQQLGVAIAPDVVVQAFLRKVAA
jgi:hypothetical protein